jgi:siroheme synthase (precorrin-2 oxidase/ferrochelatase)
MLNQNEELDVEEEEFESSDEQDNINLVDLASEDEADADVEA